MADTLRELLPLLGAYVDSLDNFEDAERAFRRVETERLTKAYTRDEVVKMANTGLAKYDTKAKTKAEAIEDLVHLAWGQSGPYAQQRAQKKAAEDQALGLLAVMHSFHTEADILARAVTSLGNSMDNAREEMAKGHLPDSQYAKYGAEVETASGKVKVLGYALHVICQSNASVQGWATRQVQKRGGIGSNEYPGLNLLVEMVKDEDQAAALAAQERADRLNAHPETVSLNEALDSLGETLDSLR